MDRLTKKYLGPTFALFLLCMTAVTGATADGAGSSFRIIDDVPGAISTEPQAINNRGMVVGYFADDPARPLTDESVFMQVGRFVAAIDHPAAESTTGIRLTTSGAPRSQART